MQLSSRLTPNDISFPVKNNSFPTTTELFNQTWLLKDEFHVTLLSSGGMLLHHLVEDRKIKKYRAQQMINRYLSASKILAEFTTEPLTIECLPELRHFARDQYESIAVMCTFTRTTTKLINRLKKHMGTYFNFPITFTPPHITLYTLNGQKAVGLKDENDLNIYTKRILPLQLS